MPDDLTQEHPTGSPMLTIAEAARATGTHRPLIRHMLKAGAFPNATKDQQGFWRIAEHELIAAGLTLVSDEISEPALPWQSDQEEAVRLRMQLAQMRLRAERAETLLDAERRLAEQQRLVLDTARETIQAMKRQMIGGAPPESTPAPLSPSPLSPSPLSPAPLSPAPRLAPAPRRSNWQMKLRAARAREAQTRAARARAQSAESPAESPPESPGD